MSKATKAFDKVMKLEKDGSNWTPTSAAEEQQQDKDLLNGIISTLPDTIFRHYKNKPTSKELWDALKQDYDAKDPLTEASLEKQVFSLTCTNPAKVGKHLNNLITIMDKLAKRGVSIPDSQFKLAIISSTPNMYQATVKALIIVYREEPSKLTPEMLIAAIHAEAQGKNFASSSNKLQESVNYSNDNFQGRGHGRFRGRGGRGRGNSRGGQGGSSFRGQGNFRGRGQGGAGGNWQGKNQTREEPSYYNCGGLSHFSKNCLSKRMQHTKMIGIIEKTERDSVSSSREKNKEDKGSWIAIEIPEIKDSIDHPTIDCSDITEEAAFIASEHIPPILFDSGCSSHMSPLRDQLRNYQTIPTR
ncbi:hypothetical protein D9758_018761 [Tetrapyrgos nigripes]|uniref:Gag protein n=1 Tax=Tetrapyrgos nigripes TaxID=182062 RepID=A0A8H5BC98_9AGAR|nr:hypothetical protein D9758_018761 [Tetrapyrgos nigripes]